MEKGKLFIIATPIGNTGDLSPRAAETLQTVDIVACEDTRTSGIFLNTIGIPAKKLTALHKFNEEEASAGLVQKLLEGQNIAVITDAGTPCISDPGTALVSAAVAAGIEVTACPGPSAVITALSVSGFNTISFAFYGFLPKKDGEIVQVFERIAGEYARIAVFYESPRRILNTVSLCEKVLPDSELCLCNDLTKKFERIYRGSPASVTKELSENPDREKGEYVLLIRLPASSSQEESCGPRGALLEAYMDGIDLYDAVRSPELNKRFSKNDLKKAALEIKEFFNL